MTEQTWNIPCWPLVLKKNVQVYFSQFTNRMKILVRGRRRKEEFSWEKFHVCLLWAWCLWFIFCCSQFWSSSTGWKERAIFKEAITPSFYLHNYFIQEMQKKKPQTKPLTTKSAILVPDLHCEQWWENVTLCHSEQNSLYFKARDSPVIGVGAQAALTSARLLKAC